MTRATCSISPIVFLYRIGALQWLPELFDEIWMPSVVMDDLLQARFVGYNIPSPLTYPWVQFADPQLTVPVGVGEPGLEFRRGSGHVTGF